MSEKEGSADVVGRVLRDAPRLAIRQFMEKNGKQIGKVVLDLIPGSRSKPVKAFASLLPTIGTTLAALTPNTTFFDYVDDIVLQELFRGISEASLESPDWHLGADIDGVDSKKFAAAVSAEPSFKLWNKIFRLSETLPAMEKDRFDKWFENLQPEQSEKLFSYLDGASDDEIKTFIGKHPSDMNSVLGRVVASKKPTPWTYLRVRKLTKVDADLDKKVQSFLRFVRSKDKDNFKENEKKFWGGVVHYLSNPDDLKFLMELPNDEVLDFLRFNPDPLPTFKEAYERIEKLWAEGTSLRRAYESVMAKMPELPKSFQEVKTIIKGSAQFQTVDDKLAADGPVDKWLQDRRAKAQARINKHKRR